MDLFNQYDTDDSGCLDYQEIRKMLKGVAKYFEIDPPGEEEIT